MSGRRTTTAPTSSLGAPSALGARRSALLGLAWRESRTARRRLLLYMSSISLGVAALVAIDSFAGNVIRSVRAQSRALFGGDVVFEARSGWTTSADSLLDALRQQGMTITKATSFASMALSPRTGLTRLVQVRAVGEGYPLYGEITTSPAGRWSSLQQGRNLIAEPALFLALDAHAGDSISIGSTTFALVAAIQNAPTRTGFSTVLGPAVFMPERYLKETRLIVNGSLASYEAFAKLSSGNATTVVRGLRPTLDRLRVRANTVAQMEGGLTNGIDILSNFLGVVGIVALLLGGVGVASGVHAWVMRKIDTVAVLRCLGATTRQVMVIYVTQAAVMGLLGALIGAVLGIGIQFLLPGVVRGMLPVDVTVRLEPQAITMGVVLGLWIALAFALRPLIALRRVSPLQALRRNEDPSPLRRGWRDAPRLAVNALIVLSVIGLAATRSRTTQQTLAFSAAIGAALLLLAVSAAVLATGARRALRRGWPYVVRQGVANLYRPGNQTRSVVLSLGFGAFLVTTLYLVQNNLLAEFKQLEVESRGNLVFFDVQDDQAVGVDSIIRVGGNDVLEQVPIVTMRVASINGHVTSELMRDTTRDNEPESRRNSRGATDSTRRREPWALRREFRSTFRDHLTSSETLVAGRWFAHADSLDGGPPYEVSLERDVANSLRVQLGDTITWNVQGVMVETRLTSLRDVNWQRFEPNFFAVFEPAALRHAPKMYALLVLARGDTAVAHVQRDVVRRFPNVAAVDLSLVRRTVAAISHRATLAIRFLALFSLAMGIPVLFSAVSATRRERVREGVLLKTLGATRRQITRILFSEYVVLGVLGSLTGMILSFAGAWLLLRYVFERPFQPAVAAAIAIGAVLLVLTVGIGLLAGRDVFRETPMAALREI
jgi:putative ABC transport system permease protein